MEQSFHAAYRNKRRSGADTLPETKSNPQRDRIITKQHPIRQAMLQLRNDDSVSKQHSRE